MDKLSPPDETNRIEPGQSPASPETPPADEGAGQPGGPTLRARGEALTARGRKLMTELERGRPEHASIEVGFRWIARDREIAGGVLGGGLAYRFFFWMLSFSVLAAGGLGFLSRAGTKLASASEDVGVGEAVADTIATTGQQAESGRWWLLLVGVYLVLWFSWALLRALWLTHAAAWRLQPPSIANGPKMFAAVLAAPFVLAAASAGAGWVRAHVDPAGGAIVTIAVSIVFGAGWLWISTKLPRPDIPWTAFLPGAALLAVGFTALHVFTVYYLAEKLAHSSALYGALGLAATVLFYLYLIGRGVIWAAELNAVVWDVRHPPKPDARAEPQGAGT